MISIIVPVYNVEEYIDDCISSILAQSWRDFELILVDDGSTDRSGSLCDSYAQKDARIQVIHQKNAGQAAARNVGLTHAKGSHIVFVDSDDYIERDMLRSMAEVEKRTDADLVMCGYKLIREEETEEKPLFNRVIKAKEFWKYAHNKKYLVACVMTCNKLIRADIFDNLRFREGIINEDTNILFPLISGCKTIAFIKPCLYCYRIREGSTMTSPYTIKRARVIYDYVFRTRELSKNKAYKEAAAALLLAADELKIAYDKLGIAQLISHRNAIEKACKRIPRKYFGRLEYTKLQILMRMPRFYIVLRSAAIILTDTLYRFLNAWKERSRV